MSRACGSGSLHDPTSTADTLPRVSHDPIIGEPLPNAALAVVPHQKLTDYALDPEHDDGGPKAHVFGTVLGIERGDWRYLHDAILEDLPRRPISGAREPAQPSAVRTWEVRVRVEGLNGRSAWVLTGWKVVDERPVLVTLRVAPRGRQGPDEGVR